MEVNKDCYIADDFVYSHNMSTYCHRDKLGVDDTFRTLHVMAEMYSIG